MLRIPSWHNHELSLRQNKSRMNQAPVTFSRITFSFSGGKLVEVSDQDMKLMVQRKFEHAQAENFCQIDNLSFKGTENEAPK